MRREHAGIALLVATLLTAGCQVHPGSILRAVGEQLRLHPAMQVQDLYKLVHQAAFGNGHAITDEAAARQHLLTELESVKADETEPLTEQIGASFTLARFNLRPFKARGLDPERLVDAMLASARTFRPDPDLFERSWQEIVEAAGRSRYYPWSVDELRAFAAARKAEGYPAVHHSDIYNARYQPAYRVLTLAEAAKVVQSKPLPSVVPSRTPAPPSKK